MNEAELRDRIAAALESHGFDVRTEEHVHPQEGKGWRRDITVRKKGADKVAAIIEVKLSDFVKGVGQLHVYSADIKPTPRLILAVPDSEKRNRALRRLSRMEKIEVWFVPEGAISDTPFGTQAFHELKCGCIPGQAMCSDAQRAWLAVGLAHQRGARQFGTALTEFGKHYEPATYEPSVREVA